MTKLRAPDSIEDAVMQACALLGTEAISTALSVPSGRTFSGSLINKWADPDNHAHRIGLLEALAIEALLVKSGHEPLFAELFKRLQPLEGAPAAPVDPVDAAVSATIDAAGLLKGVREAVRDGQLQWHEVTTLRAGVTRLQRELAALKGALVVKPAGKGRG